MMCNNLDIDLVNITAYIKFGELLSICSQYIERKKMALINGHNSVINLQKITGNIPNQDFVNINAHIKLGEISSICSQDIERNRTSDISQGPYYNSVTNARTMMCKNPNLDHVNTNARTKLG